jgi:hypothetical protein
MARKKIIVPAYYVYYDKSTGKILAVTNEKHSVHKHSLEITQELHHKFVSGAEQFENYSVGRIRGDDGKTTVKLVSVQDNSFGFKNTMFEIVSDVPTKNTELTVTWNKSNKEWEFSITNECSERIKNNINSKLIIFFVILADDYDFLIRTIFIDPKKLLSSNHETVKFESDIESKIDKISIATNLLFESHGLVLHD